MAQIYHRKLQVFISSTFSDLKQERQVAVSAILENGHIPAGMEAFAAGDEEQMQVIRRWIDQSDIFLLLLGKRYGSIEPKSGKSYTHLEYEYAIEKKIPFFAIVLSDRFIESKIKNNENILENLIEQINLDKFKEFHQLVTSKMCSFADDAKDIKIKIWQSIRDLESRYEFNGWVSAQQIPNTSKILEEITSLTEKINLTQEENIKLKKTIEDFEVKASKKNDYEGKAFEELYKILNNEIIEISLDDKQEFKIPLLKAFDHFASYLAKGVSSSAGRTTTEAIIFNKVASPLAVYGLMQADKVPSSVYWKRFVLSDLGKRFLYELRTKNNNSELSQKPKVKSVPQKKLTNKKPKAKK